MDAVDEATATLRALNREFPGDPDVLFLSVHVYSELSLRAGRALMRTAPGSPQVHELNAEALESQGKWDDAAKEYRLVLDRFPEYQGIHFKLGRLLLTRPDQPVDFDAARREFEAELKLNPHNAAAECVLGEISRQEAKWPDAIEHFSRATQLDASLFDAFLGHGRALLSAGRAAEAIPPLERAVQLQPQNPMAHLQLGNAYQQAGHKDDAAREFAALKRTSDQIKQTTDKVKAGLDGVDPNHPPR
jgi:tetratricopeptide (TPR) repeat protein